MHTFCAGDDLADLETLKREFSNFVGGMNFINQPLTATRVLINLNYRVLFFFLDGKSNALFHQFVGNSYTPGSKEAL